MRIYSYFGGVPEINPEGELRLITLWRKHHEALGFEPVILNEFIARKHPYFEEYDKAIVAMPSVNPDGYERACYLRWLALAQVGGGLMTDYDLFVLPKVGVDQAMIERGLTTARIKVYENVVPCMVTGSAEAYLDQCRRFASYVPTKCDMFNNRAHTSDMMILAAQSDAGEFDRVHLVRSWGDTNWKDAPAVHFSNASMGPAGLKPRWKSIPGLLLQHHYAAAKA